MIYIYIHTHTHTHTHAHVQYTYPVVIPCAGMLGHFCFDFKVPRFPKEQSSMCLTGFVIGTSCRCQTIVASCSPSSAKHWLYESVAFLFHEDMDQNIQRSGVSGLVSLWTQKKLDHVKANAYNWHCLKRDTINPQPIE